MHSPQIILALVLLFLSCSEEEAVETPSKIIAVTQREQIGYANEVSEPLAVRVLNTKDYPMEGVAVTFAVLKGTATIQSNVAMTDDNGVAFTYAIFAEDSPEVVIGASIEALSDIVEFDVKVSSSPASTLQLISGNDQEGLAGTELKKPFVVKVTDDFGNIAKGFPVQFKVKTGNGEVLEQTVLSNDLGEASAMLKLSTFAPQNEVVAKIANDSVIFMATSVFSTNISSLNRVSDGIQIRWEKSINPGFKKYYVYRANIHNPETFGAVKTIDNVETIDWVDLTVVQGSTYFYKIVVETETGVTATSQVKEIVNADFVALGGWGDDFVVDEDRNLIYVSMTELNQIYVIDISSRQVVEKVLIGSQPRGIALSRDNKTLYVALSGSGDVTMLDLDTKAKTVVDVEGPLGAASAYYVIEAASNRVFVSSNGGTGYLTMIKLDESNEAVRVHSEVMRDRPTLQVDYGKFLYVNGDFDLYKIDVTRSTPTVVLSKYFRSGLYPNHAVSPDGAKILVHDGELLNTNDFSLVHNFNGGVFNTFNASGSKIYSVSGGFFSSYNISSFTRETIFSVNCGEAVKFRVSADERTIYLLSRRQNLFSLYFIKNN